MKATAFITAIVLFLSIATSAEAYGIYGPYGLYGYRENTDIYENLNINKNQYDFSQSQNFLANQQGNQFSNYQQDQFTSGAQAYLDQYMQDISQQGKINQASGFSGTKKPCITKAVRGEFDGKDNDFYIKEKICDGVNLAFFKNDQVSNAYNTNTNTNRFNSGAYFNQNNILAQNTNSNKYDIAQSFTQNQDVFSKGLAVSFGKGTRIILN